MRVLAFSLAIGAICGSATRTCAETPIQPLREIHLPVSSSRGGFSLFPILDDMRAKDHFAMRVTPDQSILIFDSDASGKWLLVREKNWWTDKPASEVLSIPGWSGHLEGVYIDIEVTPDGRYAVALAGAVWGPRSKRKPDTIITVVDLERWQIVASVHTASAEGGSVQDARIANNHWLAFDERTDEPLTNRGTDQYRNWLLSIPDLKSGPDCISERFFHMGVGRPTEGSVIGSVNMRNWEACRQVYVATGTGSMEAFDALVRRGSDVEPIALKLRDVEWLEGVLEKDSHQSRNEAEWLWDAEGNADEFFRYWGGYPYYEQVWQNPPFESSARLWYGLYPSQERDVYELARYDAEGQEQKAEVAGRLACGDASIGKANAACGCRVIDVSERQNKLLTYCRKQNGDYDGMVQMEWLSVFRSDDLTGIGFIDLPKKGYTLQAIAGGDGRAYVVTLAFGDMLRVYAIPDEE